jgi:Flp pilus assembly protein TadG
MSENLARKRPGERGVTILLVAVAMVTLLGMAALAIDVVSLYVARNEAQRAADTAALAAARTFAGSGITSDPGDTTGMRSAAQSLALQAAQAAAGQHTIGGQTVAPADVNMVPSYSDGSNPQVTITVQRTNLPTFFARIWGSRLSSVRATAKAEAFNPSGSSIPISVSSVKPILIANCWNSTSNPQNLGGCGNNQYILDPNSNYSVVDPNIIGSTLVLREQDPSKQALPGWYYPLRVGNGTNDIPQATNCPSTMDVSCSGIGGGGFDDAIACAGTVPLSCGKVVTEQLSSSFNTQTCASLRCLIHADPSSFGLGQGQDAISIGGTPVTIDGGANNPNSSLRNVTRISRSDSIITLPIANDPCPAGGGGGGPGGGLNFAYLFFDHGGGEEDEQCSNGSSVNVPIVGFLQVAVRQILPSGNIEVVVLNAIGCAGTSGTPISGGGLSPVPVRLIQ